MDGHGLYFRKTKWKSTLKNKSTFKQRKFEILLKCDFQIFTEVHFVWAIAHKVSVFILYFSNPDFNNETIIICPPHPLIRTLTALLTTINKSPFLLYGNSTGIQRQHQIKSNWFSSVSWQGPFFLSTSLSLKKDIHGSHIHSEKHDYYQIDHTNAFQSSRHDVLLYQRHFEDGPCKLEDKVNF